jgi:hypothetical protein
MNEIHPSQVMGLRVKNHYTIVGKSQNLLVINVKYLKCILVYLATDENAGRQYVVKMPNSYGHAILK